MRFKDIQRLVKILETSSLVRIETPPQQSVEKAGKTEGKTDNLVAIKSPIVGTFYRSSAPDAPPYVEVGDIVKPGQVVCIVEAMKLMNEIESDIAGKVVKMLAKNEDPVEYNQELFMVEPT
jgi:acetyl-CoA carboxylase biotin carboxyl carrier protein